MWDKMKLKSVTPYRSHPRLKSRDRVTVVIDMPIETYSDFRRQVEAPRSLLGRRTTDPKRNGTPKGSVEISKDLPKNPKGTLVGETGMVT